MCVYLNLDEVWEYDPVIDSWWQVTSITGPAPSGRRLASMAVVNGWTYFVGGQYLYGVYSDVWGTPLLQRPIALGRICHRLAGCIAPSAYRSLVPVARFVCSDQLRASAVLGGYLRAVCQRHLFPVPWRLYFQYRRRLRLHHLSGWYACHRDTPVMESAMAIADICVWGWICHPPLRHLYERNGADDVQSLPARLLVLRTGRR